MQDLILHYDFASVSSTIVPDVTLSGSTGVIRGADRGGAFMENASVFGRQGQILTLTGGKNGGFLQLPDGILNNTDGITISFYCNVHDLSNYGTICSFGADNCLYLSALPDPEDPSQILLSPGATKGGRSQEAALYEWQPVRTDTWFHVVITMDTSEQAKVHFYLDGVHKGNFEHRRMQCSDLNDCTDCYFGYGALSRNALSVSFSDIRIFKTCLDKTHIASLFDITDDARLHMEADLLSALFHEPLTSDLHLPSNGSMQTDIVWKSETPDAVDDQGTLKRPPAGCPDAEAVLTALISYHESSLSKRFSFLVPALPDAEALLAMDIADIHIPYAGHLTDAPKLPDTGTNGSVFCWISSNEEIYCPADGQFHRPQTAPVSLRLTVEASLEDCTAEKTYDVCFWPKSETLPENNGGYTESSMPDTLYHRADAIPFADVFMLDNALFTENQKRCTDYLLLLDTDRMLYNFRKTFHQDTKGALPLGGWEEPAGLLRGHSTGHYLSALALAYASAKNEAFSQKADTLLQELYRLQQLSQGDPAAFTTQCTPARASQSLWSQNPEVWGEGFLSAYSPDQFALLEQFTPYATIWAPYYTLHKLLAGFLDCWQYMHNETALLIAEGIGSWVYRRLSPLTDEHRAKMWSMYIAGEYGGMNESLAKLSRITKNTMYLEAAKMFDNPGVFDGLSKNEDSISGIHANQHIPQIIGAMEEFEATKDPYYYHVARNFWHIVTKHYMYSIGGVGRGENFKEPDKLAVNIEADRNCETCAAYNLLKLTGMLYSYEPDNSYYMDYYERTMINQIASSQNPVVSRHMHNGVTYMLPIGPGAKREYSSDYEDFTCCHGTGMENHVRYPEYAFHTTPDGEHLYVNLFFSSKFTMPDKEMSFTLEAPFPGEEKKLTVCGNGRLSIHIRIPYWCRDSFAVEKNGAALPSPDCKCGYYLIEDTFHDGDIITIHTPYHVHLCYTPDTLDGSAAASILYGPLVMTAIDASTDWLTLKLPPAAEAAFEIEWEQTPILWYDHLKLIPMYQAHNMPYHTYFKIETMK